MKKIEYRYVFLTNQMMGKPLEGDWEPVREIQTTNGVIAVQKREVAIPAPVRPKG